MLQIRLTICLLYSTVLGCAAPSAAEQPANVKQWCIVNEEKLTELSGLAPYLGGEETLFWAHNDGSRSKLYLLDSDGDTRATVDIDGTHPIDCEDLCSFQIGERRFLLLADTGDNDLRRKSSKLYLIEEPKLEQLKETTGKKKKKEKPPHLKLSPIATIEFNFPGGTRNCEAVGIDTLGSLIVLVSKEKNPGCELFTLPLPCDNAGQVTKIPDTQTATLVGRVEVPTITALAIDPHAKGMILLGRAKLFVFTRPQEPLPSITGAYARMIKQGAKILDKPKQEQGEAVSFSPDGKKLYIASEGKKQPIWELQLGE